MSYIAFLKKMRYYPRASGIGHRASGYPHFFEKRYRGRRKKERDF
ncbi:hypothetical protein [Microcoleus sp. bin38.metabat.b11b12b14.051]|nr:hypothetical protein [Microcoleus sp. bin38.metabat.b11b12b14.051]